MESEPPGAEAKTSQGQTCRTPCELVVQTGGEFSVTLALAGYQPQTVPVRNEAPSGITDPALMTRLPGLAGAGRRTPSRGE